jgi:hypothetical protein
MQLQELTYRFDYCLENRETTHVADKQSEFNQISTCILFYRDVLVLTTACAAASLR